MTEEDIRVGKYALAKCIYVLKEIKIVGPSRASNLHVLSACKCIFHTHSTHILYKGSLTNVNAYVGAKTKSKTKQHSLKKTNRSGNHLMTTSAE